MESVLIEPNCVATIVSSALEVYNKETNGYILSRPKRIIKKIHGRKTRVMNLSVAYPFQTDERRPTEVFHKNTSAAVRVIDSLNSMGVRLIGGFHSHVYPHNKTSLSDEDVEHILDEMNVINGNGVCLRQWLELVVAIKKREYETPQRLGYIVKSNAKGITVKIKTKRRLGFDLKIAGYWITPNGKGAIKRCVPVYTKYANKYF
jgi:proteasome lid subunit RPN8/RPN11